MTLRAMGLTAALAIAALVAASAPASTKNATNSPEMIAKVIAVDLQAKSIGIVAGTGESQTFFVVGKAAESLDQLPIGRMFKLTLQNGADGTRRDVIAIKRAKDVPEN
jgi:hypothetical protein